MNHEKFEEHLATQVTTGLSEADDKILREHLDTGCATCRELQSALREVAEVLPSSVEPMAVPANVKARVMNKIGTRPWILPKWAFATAAAALVLIVVLPRFFKNPTQPSLVKLDDRVVLVVAPKADYSILPKDNGYQVTLNKGALGSQVKTGTSYSVVTNVLTTEAKGTVFFVNVENPNKVYVCICNGHIALTDPGFHQDLEAVNHKAVIATKANGVVTTIPAPLLYH